MTNLVLEVNRIEKEFNSSSPLLRFLNLGGPTVKAVNGVDLELQANQTHALIGESGCGKSTVAKMIMGILEPTRGVIKYKGNKLQPDQISNKPIQMVFQDPSESLNNKKTVGNILMGALKQGDWNDREARKNELLNSVGLDQSLSRKYPGELSGGQKQRVALARAISNDPEILIADEPVSGLDVSSQAKIINLINKLQRKNNMSLLIISHNLGVVKTIADRVSIMYLGEIIEAGKKENVFRHPAHPYTRALLSATPSTDITKKGTERIILQGEVPSPENPPSGCSFHTRCPNYIGNVCKNEVPKFSEESENSDWPLTGGQHKAKCHHFE